MADDDDVTPQAAKGSRSRVWRTLGIVALVLALVAGGVLVYRSLDRTRIARRHVDEAALLLSQAEPSVIAADAAVRSEITTALITTAPEALASADDASRLLTKARAELDSVGAALSDTDRPLAEALSASVDARLTMMSESTAILQVDERAATVLEPARIAWSLAAEAETLTVDATTEYNRHTKAGVEKSTALSKQAATKLASARSLLETVSAGFSEADMGPFLAYIDARVALITQSQKIDSTWLTGKVADANTLLTAYNAQEAKVVKQANALSGTPVSTLAAAYDTLTKEGIGRYFAAREAARAADVQVKDAATAR